MNNTSKPSYMLDVEKLLGKEGALDFENQIKDPYEQIIQETKAMFSFLKEEDIREIMLKYNNSVDAAFDELSDRNSHIEESLKKERIALEEKRRIENNNKYIETFVRNFQMFEKSEIERVFRENNNDPRITAQVLYNMVKEKEKLNEEAKKQKQEMERQQKFNAICNKFPELSKDEIQKIFNTNSEIDIETISFELEIKQKQKFFEELFLLYSNLLTSVEITQCLEEAKWVKIEANRLCKDKCNLKLKVEVENKKEETAPKLELNEKQIQECKKTSMFKKIQIEEFIDQEEKKNDEQMLKGIEKIIIENVEPSVLSEPIVEIDKIVDNSNIAHNIIIKQENNKISAKIELVGQTNYSWVGFYLKQEQHANYLVYNYIYKLTDNTLIVDTPTLNGTYEFRCFISKYNLAITSQEIEIKIEDKVTIEKDEKNNKVTNVKWQVGSFDPYLQSSYVTIHKKEEERYNYYRRWNWMKTPTGVHTFKTPIHNGVYEARVYVGSVLKFRSGELHIIDGI